MTTNEQNSDDKNQLIEQIKLLIEEIENETALPIQEFNFDTESIIASPAFKSLLENFLADSELQQSAVELVVNKRSLDEENTNPALTDSTPTIDTTIEEQESDIAEPSPEPNSEPNPEPVVSPSSVSQDVIDYSETESQNPSLQGAGQIHPNMYGKQNYQGPVILTQGNISTAEGADTALNISIVQNNISDAANTEITITRLPEQATLNKGVKQDDGSWKLSEQDLEGLIISFPDNYASTFLIEVSASTHTSQGECYSSSEIFFVHMVPDADGVTLQCQGNLVANEDEVIPLGFTCEVIDSDSEYVYSFTLSGVPDGVTVTNSVKMANGDWFVSVPHLEGAEFILPDGFSGSFEVTAVARSNDYNGVEMQNSETFTVTVNPVPDEPLVTTQGDIKVIEDEQIKLDIAANLQDTDGSEVLDIVIDGLPFGVGLNAGIKNEDGTWTVNQGDLEGLEIITPTHYSGDFTVVIKSTATETETGDSATNTTSFNVHIEAEADIPTLAVGGNKTIEEDSSVFIKIKPALVDTDGSETLSLVLEGMPEGTVLSAGTDNGNGTWTLTPEELEELHLTPPENYSGGFTVKVTAISEEPNGSKASTNASFDIKVVPVIDEVEIQVQDNETVAEDNSVALDISIDLIDSDGSESVLYEISDLPEGSTLNVGIEIEPGVWQISPEEISDVKFTPPQHFSGDITLTATAIITENDGQEYRSSDEIDINITPVADKPILQPLSDIKIEEDGILPIKIDASLVDTDGSENLTIQIKGLPEEVKLNTGSVDSNGIWTVSAEDLENLQIIAPEHYSNKFELQVTAIATESDGSTATSSDSMVVGIVPVADKPILEVEKSGGKEDELITLNINASLVDTDGSEDMVVYIDGLPEGTLVSNAMLNEDGVWVVNSGDIDNISILPPKDYSGEFEIKITAVTTDSNGDSTQISEGSTVTIEPVADTPAVVVPSEVVGDEDTKIPLTIFAQPTDIDGSETLEIKITDLPEGFALSYGEQQDDGTWLIKPDDLDNIYVIPPENFNGEIKFSIEVTAIDGNDTNTVTNTVGLSVKPVADDPIIEIKPAYGYEDQKVELNVNAYLENEGTDEIAKLIISGVPEGAVLYGATPINETEWEVIPPNLERLVIAPPPNSNEDFALNFKVITQDGDDINETNVPVPVFIKGVADKPVVTAQDTTAMEDGGAVPLKFSAQLTDTDGSETIETFTLEGVPEGIIVTGAVLDNAGDWVIPVENIEGVSLILPENYYGSFDLNLTANVIENDGDTASSSTTFNVSIASVPDVPECTIAFPAEGLEDTPIPLHIAAKSHDENEELSITIENIPAGSTLNAGEDLGGGKWQLTAKQLEGLTITPPADSNEDFTLKVTATSTDTDGNSAFTSLELPVGVTGVADMPKLVVENGTGNEDDWINLGIKADFSDADGSESLSITISGVPQGAKLSAGTANDDGSYTLSPEQLSGLKVFPPQDFSGDFSLFATATTTENDGDIASEYGTLVVSVEGVGDAPSVSTETATGNEDTPIGLSIKALDTDIDSSEVLSKVLISGVPEGAVLSTGTDLGNGVWEIDPAIVQQENSADFLTILPQLHSDTDFTLKVEITSTEPNGASKTTARDLKVKVKAVADEPVANANDVAGLEDTAIPLNLSSSRIDNDGSESLGIVISGIPDGASLAYGRNLGGGRWSISSGNLSRTSLTPPKDFNGEIDLVMTATTKERRDGRPTETVETPFKVSVVGVADEPDILVMPIKGFEDQPITFDIDAWLSDTDGSESLYVIFDNIPDGATFSHGEALEDGTWKVSASDLDNVTITPPLNSNDNFTLTAKAMSEENDGDTAYSKELKIPVQVKGVADMPNVAVVSTTALEDELIKIDLSPSLTDIDGSEVLSVVIQNLPNGAKLNSGTYIGGGRYSFTGDDIANIGLTMPQHYSGQFNLDIQVVSTENDGGYAVNDIDYTVNVTPVADSPVISGGAEGLEDTAIPLRISLGLTDKDGSEVIADNIIIENVPDGAVLNNGTPQNNGRWLLNKADLEGLTITPPADSNENFSIVVTAVAEETNGNVKSASSSIAVDVTGVADEPEVYAEGATGRSAEPITVSVHGYATDTDGSEDLTYLVDDVPNGWLFTTGYNNGDGSWTFTEDQINSLQVIAPRGFTGEVTFQAYSISHENDGDINVADTPAPMTITIYDNGGGEWRPVYLDEDITEQIPQIYERLIAKNWCPPHVKLLDVPEGTQLSSGTLQSDGTWLVPFNDLQTLEITAPEHSNEDFYIDVTMVGGGWRNGDGQTLEDLPVYVKGIADKPSVEVTNEEAIEDNPTQLYISAESPDQDGSETLSYVLSDLPAGFEVVGGINNGNGKITVPPSQINDIILIPAENFVGKVDFTVTAVTQENDGHYTTNSISHTLDYDERPDGVTVQGGSSGIEDNTLPFDLTTILNQTNDDEAVVELLLSGAPEGSVITGGETQGGGVYKVDLNNIDNLTFTPPKHEHGSFTVNVEAVTATPNGYKTTSYGSVSFNISAEADAPNLVANNITTDEDVNITLDLSSTLIDTDGSEQVVYLIDNVPDEVIFTTGSNNGDGSWTFTGGQLASGITMQPPKDFSGDIELVFKSLSQEKSNLDEATSEVPFVVTVNPIADTPAVKTFGTKGAEDEGAIPLSIEVTSADYDGSEELFVVLSGFPEGSTFSAGIFNEAESTHTVSEAELAGLTITPPQHWGETFTLNIEAQSHDGSSIASAMDSITVNMTASVDEAVIEAQNSSAEEDNNAPISLSAALQDMDGSETMALTLTGLPSGFTLNKGTQSGSTWKLEPADLDGLEVIPVEHYSGTLNLKFTAQTTESKGQTATVSKDFTVEFTPVIDDPLLTASNTTQSEDTAADLNFTAALQDTDGSETLEVMITGIPDDFSLNKGEQTADGWKLNQSQLSGVKLTSPDGYSGKLDLGITATSKESNGQTKVITDNMSVEFTPVADTPYISAIDVEGVEGESFSLNLDASLNDMDGSETLSLLLKGVPEGADIGNATFNNGNWEIDPNNLDSLDIKIDNPGEFDLQLVATATEQGAGGAVLDSAEALADFTVRVTEVPEEDENSEAAAAQAGAQDDEQAAGEQNAADNAASDNSGSEENNDAGNM